MQRQEKNLPCESNFDLLFELVESRTLSNGYPFQRWEGTGYEVTCRQYSATGFDIHVRPTPNASRFAPYIYVVNDDEGTPAYIRIETTAYGGLPVEDYRALQQEMTVAVAVAESIEEKFIASATRQVAGM